MGQPVSHDVDDEYGGQTQTIQFTNREIVPIGGEANGV